jgi:imidazolonepropionase-like amidohydrolase
VIQALCAAACIALSNATVIDGTGAAPVAARTVVIEQGRIAAVFATGSRTLPARAQVIDLTGRWLLPGFIDSHVHVATDPTGSDANAPDLLRRALMGGVTSVRDMAGDAIALQALAARSRPADAVMPRLYYVALVAGPSFFTDPRTKASAHGGTPGDLPWLRAITPSTDLPAVVREAKTTGATAIKIYADLPAEMVARVTAEAHRQGLRVWSHSSVFPANAVDATDAGVDVLSHALYLYWAAIPNPPQHYSDRVPPRSAYDSVPADGAAMRALFAKMRARGTVFDATLFVAQRFEAAPGPAFGLVDPPRAAQWAYDATRAAKNAGVIVSAGTDGFMPDKGDGPPNVHREMELLVKKSGFSPLEAITAATLNGALAIGAADSLGTIAVGKLADLVVLSADPVVDIANTRQVVMVLRGGVVHHKP